MFLPAAGDNFLGVFARRRRKFLRVFLPAAGEKNWGLWGSRRRTTQPPKAAEEKPQWLSFSNRTRIEKVESDLLECKGSALPGKSERSKLVSQNLINSMSFDDKPVISSKREHWCSPSADLKVAPSYPLSSHSFSVSLLCLHLFSLHHPLLLSFARPTKNINEPEISTPNICRNESLS